jgi:hypothetical protein
MRVLKGEGFGVLKSERNAGGTYRHQVFFPVDENARRRSQTQPKFRWVEDAELAGLDPSLEQQAANGRIRCDMELAKLRTAERQVDSDGDDDWSDGWGAGSSEHAGSRECLLEEEREEEEGEQEEDEEGEAEGFEEGEEQGEEGEGEEQNDLSAGVVGGGGMQPSTNRRRGEDVWGVAEACPELGEGWVVQVSVGGRKRNSSPDGGRLFSLQKARDLCKDGTVQPPDDSIERPVFPQARGCRPRRFRRTLATLVATGLGSQPGPLGERCSLCICPVYLSPPRSDCSRPPHPPDFLLP